MIKLHRNLSRELSWGIMLLAVPFFIVALGLFFLQSRYLIHQEAMESSQSMLNTTMQRVKYYMQTVETAADANAWMLEENFEPQTIQAVSDRIVRLNHNVVSCSVYAIPNMFPQYGPKFSVFTKWEADTLTTYLEPEYDYQDKLCYTKPAETGKACWVEPFIEYSEGKVDYQQAIATYSKPLLQKNGRIIGVLAVDLSFSSLAKLINEGKELDDESYYMLIDSDGRYLIHPDTTRLFRKTLFTDADPNKHSELISLGHEMTSGNRGSLHVHDGNQFYHVCYQPVEGTNWSMALVCPDSQMMHSSRTLEYVMIALVVLGLVAILVLSSIVVKQTVKEAIVHLQNSFAQVQIVLDEKMSCLRQRADEARQQNWTLKHDVQKAESNMTKRNRFMLQITQRMRSPINVISGFATMLRESSSNKAAISGDELANISSMMKSNAVGLNSMLLMLRDASESDTNDTLKFKKDDEVPVNALAQECMQYALTHFPNASIEFLTTVSDTLCILTNRHYLMPTLRELLCNAAKYSDGQHIKLKVNDTDSTVRFTVEDIGPGMPADKEDHLFKPFTREGDLSEGLGLGLPLARRHAKSLGGKLIFDGNYQQGCRVTIELPK